MTVTERLLHYVSFDTQSDESSETCPSTAKQKLLGEALVEEMRALGIADARIDADGYVYGSVPGTPGAPAIGLIAHMDTSPDCSGRDIKPRIVEYTGGDIALNDTTALSPEDFLILSRSIGKHLIVTDGTTLLGADDKAGIAEILTAVEELLAEGGAHASCASASRRTRRSAAARTASIWRISARTTPTPSTAARSASWNMRISTPPPPL